MKSGWHSSQQLSGPGHPLSSVDTSRSLREASSATMTAEEPPAMSTIREEIHKLADQLPADASWDDAMYALYVRRKIDAGRKAIAEGHLVTQEGLEQQIAEWQGK